MTKVLKKSKQGIHLMASAGVPLALMLLPSAPFAAQMFNHEIAAKQSSMGTSYLSGGVGLEERHKMMQMARGYDLKLVFVDRRGDYLSDVKVTIDDEHGQQILSATSDGPWLYVKLPDGKYNVKAKFGQTTEEIKSVAISQNHQLSKVLLWNISA